MKNVNQLEELIQLIQERITLSKHGWINVECIERKLTQHIADLSKSFNTVKLNELFIRYMVSRQKGENTKSDTLLQKMKRYIENELSLSLKEDLS